MIYGTHRHFNGMFKSLWADSGLLKTDPDLLLYNDRFKTAFKRSGMSLSYFQKTFIESIIQISLSTMSIDSTATLIHAKVSHLHTKVSYLHAKVSHLHTKVSYLHAKVSHLHAKVSHLHTKVSYLHTKVSHLHTKVSYLSVIFLNFFKISISKLTSIFLWKT
jgi:outer membrane murein-binding lipoprotein Lpp